MERGKMPSSGRGGKSKGPQHPQDIFALGTKSTVVVSRDSEKRGSIHKPSTSGVDRKRDTTGFGSQPPSKRSRIGSPAEAVGGTSLEVDPVDLVPSVLQALDTHNSDKLLGLLTGSIRLLKSQRSKPDPILCMSLLYLTKIRPNMFAHETVTNILCTLLKREQGAAFKNKGNPLVFVLACNMLYAGHRENNNWPDIFIKVYIEDALNERWWVECAWCKCLVENIVTAFGTKQPPPHLIPSDNTLGTMSPSGSGSPLMGNAEEEAELSELDYSVFPRYSSSHVTVEHLVLAAINDQIQRRSAAPDNIGKGFLKLLSATCGFPEIRMLSAVRLEGWLNSGKLWRCGQELLAYVCVNCDAVGATAARDHEVLAQLARMRLKTKPLQAAYQSCLREMVSESPALLRSVVTHTIYNELSNVRSPNNMAVLAALIAAQPAAVPAAMADTYMELMMRPEEYLRPLRALTRECVRGARTNTAVGGLANEGGVAALLPLARALASPSAEAAATCTAATAEVRERAFLAIADLFCLCCLVTASAAGHARAHVDQRSLLTQVSALQAAALGWLLEYAVPAHRPSRHDFQLAFNKIMFVESAETYSKVDNWPAESERASLHRLCCEAPLPQYNLMRIMFIGLSKELPVSSAEVFSLVEQLVRRACALPAEDNPLLVDKLEVPEYLFQLCAFEPPENITLPVGYTPPPLAITSLYWRAWIVLTMIAAHNPHEFAERAAATYPTLRALIETCITNGAQPARVRGARRRHLPHAASAHRDLHHQVSIPPPLAITSLYWRAWIVLTMIAAHNPHEFAERAAATYPTLRALIETCITNKPSIEWNNSTAADSEVEKVAILQLETHLATASNAKLPVTEHTSRMLSQLTTMEPQGPARKPPAGVVESLQTLSSQLRLGKLLCRQPALLLELVERHGTRRAMPWLHRLLRQDRLQLSVLPVQCLCEFLSAGGGTSGPGEGKAGELCAHLRRTLHETEDGARAVLHYYTQRLSHSHAPTRAQASRGLKLVLTETEDATEMDYNAEVSPEEWLDLLWDLPQWEAVRDEVVPRVRAACLVECVPRHLAAYIAFLARHARATPHADHTDIVLELSQVLMERTTVMSRVVGAGEARDHELGESELQQHRTLHALTTILYDHLQKIRVAGPDPTSEVEEGVWPDGERVTLQWPSGRKATLHVVVAHAHLKLLCLGPSMYDTNQTMYSWLLNVWVGDDAPHAFHMDSHLEAVLLPDWLRLHLVRSARPQLLAAGLRALPATKLALFIQTFGMPRSAMSALLGALDGCPAGTVSRLGVERGYMSQLLLVQRARGATGGAAFAAALGLRHQVYPPDDDMFAEKPLPQEDADDWGITLTPAPLQIELVPSLLSSAFAGATSFLGDMDTAFTQLVELLTEEIALVKCNPHAACPYLSCVITFLQACACGAGPGGLLRRPAHAAVMLRPLRAHRADVLAETAATLLQQCKCVSGPVVSILQELSQVTAFAPVKRESAAPRLPPNATREHLIAVLESATPNTLEDIGNSIIESQDTGLIVDVITHLLEKNQEGFYESKIKTELECEVAAHVFSGRGRGCGLLLDWLSELQRENNPERLMRLMFGSRGRDDSAGGKWVALLVTLHAHRASCRALHGCLASLLSHTNWNPTAALDFAETLVESPRVWQGRDRHTPKHARPRDTLRLTYKQLEVLVHYIVAEASSSGSAEGTRLCIERRLPLLLRCCRARAALTAAALAAARDQPALLLLLHMKVPKIRQLLSECEERPPVSCPLSGCAPWRAAASASTHATDRVSHAVLSALPHPTNHTKDHEHKMTRLDNGIRALWSRCWGAGARALPLAAALLRGALPLHAKQHTYLLAALEALPVEELFAEENSEEMYSILEGFLSLAKNAGGKAGSAGALMHRVAALLRRYMQVNPQQAAQLLNAHANITQCIPALSSLQSGELSAPASASPPPHALLALQRRNDTPENLHWNLQEIESWGSRRGGAWGGAGCADAVLRCVAPLAAAPHAPLRTTALAVLAKILPAVTDTKPGLQAILECLDSSLPEVTQSALDKLPDIVTGMQEHAARILLRVFELGVQARHPVEPCLARCVTALNAQRGC